MKCHDARVLIARGSPLSAELSAHVGACPACKEAVEAEAQLDALLGAAFSDHPFGDAAVERVLVRVRAQRERARARRTPVVRVVAAGALVAAAALVIGLNLELWREPEAPAPGRGAAATRVARAGTGLLRDAGDGVLRPARPGSDVLSGDRLVAERTPAEVLLLDGSRLDLRAGTQCVVREGPDGVAVAVGGAEGEVFCEVARQQRPFRVEAPGLRVAVLGTRFLVRHGARTGGVVVLDGAVEVATRAGRHVLRGGEAADVLHEAGGVLAPLQVTPLRVAMWVPRVAEELRNLPAPVVPGPPPLPPEPPPALPPPPLPDPSLDQPVEPPTRAPR